MTSTEPCTMSGSREPQRHSEPHECFGCHEMIGAFQPHIHVPLDEWAVREGLSAVGMDDLLTFAFCEPCTQPTENGWQLEQHA